MIVKKTLAGNILRAGPGARPTSEGGASVNERCTDDSQVTGTK